MVFSRDGAAATGGSRRALSLEFREDGGDVGGVSAEVMVALVRIEDNRASKKGGGKDGRKGEESMFARREDMVGNLLCRGGSVVRKHKAIIVKYKTSRRKGALLYCMVIAAGDPKSHVV